MRKLLLAALIGLSVAACQTPQQSAGTAGGVVAGAIVAGPVGAVVGGVAGAVVAAPGGPLIRAIATSPPGAARFFTTGGAARGCDAARRAPRERRALGNIAVIAGT